MVIALAFVASMTSCQPVLAPAGATGDSNFTNVVASGDITVGDDLTVADTLDVNGDIDLDGDGFDVDITAGFSIDGDLASNINTAAGDITIEAETGSVTVKGDEAVADAIYLDANDAAGTGVTIAVGATGGFNIGGGLTDIGGGSFAVANGDNDLGVAGDLEVDGVTQLDGALAADGGITVDTSNFTVNGTTGAITSASTGTFAGDVTASADNTGGNAGAVNQFIGVPRIDLVGIGTMANGTTNSIITDIGDSETPATDWTAIDADTTMSNDSTYYRQGTASLKMAVADTADATDGCTNALASGDQNWTDDESVGMWFYADTTLTAGDLVLVITDSGAGDTSVNFPAYATANTWEWIEIDISGVVTASKDVITDLSVELSAAGAVVAAAGAFNVYMDFIVKWDGAEEESVGRAIVQDGVMSLVVIDATDTGATSTTLTLYTDYFVHYQSGNDAIVILSDQSGADKVGLALVAY